MLNYSCRIMPVYNVKDGLDGAEREVQVFNKTGHGVGGFSLTVEAIKHTFYFCPSSLPSFPPQKCSKVS